MVKSTNKGEFPNSVSWLDIDFIKEQVGTGAPISIRSDLCVDHLSHQDKINLARELIEAADDSFSLKLNRWFDPDEYLAARPDVLEARMNPALHFFATGYIEIGVKNYDDPDKRLLDSLITSSVSQSYFDPEAIKGQWQRDLDQSLIRSALEVSALIKIACAGSGALFISISHDDPFSNSGGIQKVIREELDLCKVNNITHLNITPAQPLPFPASVTKKSLDNVVSIFINGKIECYMYEVALSQLNDQVRDIPTILAIHHLNGYNPSNLVALVLSIIKIGSVYFWIHDYSVKCINFKLLFNGWHYCGSPDLASGLCDFCEFSSSRKLAADAVTKITEISGINYLYPSRKALEEEESGYSPIPKEASKIVVPHKRVISYEPKKKTILFSDRKCRIAYPGYPAFHKGWDAFKILSSDPYLAKGFEFFHIGVGDPEIPIRSMKVDGFSHDSLDMQSALSTCQIDLAFIWPLWPETFCLVAHEAIAAGCHVITRKKSGNVASGLPVQARTVFSNLKGVRKYLLQALEQGFITVSYVEINNFENSSYTLSLIQK